MATHRVGGMAPERYRQLLEMAAREFASAGFEHASLNKIIAALGMSKSSFYHYFASKEALFDTVVREAVAELRRGVEAPDPESLAGPDFWDEITRFYERLLNLTERQAWHIEFGKLFYQASTPSAQSNALQEVLGRIATWLDRVLAVGRGCGAIRADLPASLQSELTFSVLQAMDRWMLEHVDELDAIRQHHLAEAQLATIKRLLAPERP